jgi:CheY-like chemotaxis protein
MSEEARTVLVITDDRSFSALISEHMLRAGVQTIRFAQTHEALTLTHDLLPNLVLILMTRDGSNLGQECYAMIRSDPALAGIPILLYVAPLAERAVGASAAPQSIDGTQAPDRLIRQISALLGLAPARVQTRTSTDLQPGATIIDRPSGASRWLGCRSNGET